MGRCPCSVSHFASLPVVVVLPEPCRPTIIHTEGGREAKSGLACLPSSAVSSSRTVLTTCWSGESCSITSLPMAFCRMLARSSSATPTLTSPSSRASRISASAASRCSSVSFPCPRKFLNVRCSFSVKFSNMFAFSQPGTFIVAELDDRHALRQYRSVAGWGNMPAPEHARGRHKARVFASVLGIRREYAEVLRQALLEAAVSSEATLSERDAYRQRCVLDFSMPGPGGRAMVRSTWIVLSKEDFARLTSCYVL